jgi:cytochrome c-type biogenesis protein CcmH
MRTSLAVLAVAVAMGLAGAGVWQAVQPAPTTAEQEVTAIAATLRCPTCQGLSVADSDAAISRSMRDLISEQVAASRTAEQIRGYFVERYGDWILLSPRSSGIGWLVWVLPVIALTGGMAVATGRARRRTQDVGTMDVGDARDLIAAHLQGRIALPQTPAGDRIEAALDLAGAVIADEGDAGPAETPARLAAERQVACALATQRAEARAAAVSQPPPQRTAPRRASRRRMAWIGTTTAFVVLIGGVLTVNVGPRGASQLITGNLPSTDPGPGAASTSTLGEGAPTDIAGRLAVAAEALQSGDTAQARQHAMAVLDTVPNHPDGLLVLGLAAVAEDDPVAVETLQRFLDNAPAGHPGVPIARSLLDGE